MLRFLILFALFSQETFSAGMDQLHPFEADIRHLDNLSQQQDKKAYYEEHRRVSYKVMDMKTGFTPNFVLRMSQSIIHFCLPLPLSLYDTNQENDMCAFREHYTLNVLKFYTDGIEQHFRDDNDFQLSPEDLCLYQSIIFHNKYITQIQEIKSLLEQAQYKDAFLCAYPALWYWEQHITQKIPHAYELAKNYISTFLKFALDAFLELHRKQESTSLGPIYKEITKFCQVFLALPTGTNPNIYAEIGILYNPEEDRFYFNREEFEKTDLDKILQVLMGITPNFQSLKYRKQHNKIAASILTCTSLTKVWIEKHRALLFTHRIPLPPYAIELDASFSTLQNATLEHYEALTQQKRFKGISDDDLKVFIFYYDILSENYLTMRNHTAHISTRIGKANLLRTARKNVEAFQVEMDTLKQIENLGDSLNQQRGLCLLGMAKAFGFMTPAQKNQNLKIYCTNAHKYTPCIFGSHETQQNWRFYIGSGISWDEKTQKFTFTPPVLAE